MDTGAASSSGVPRPGRQQDADRLGRRDLLVLRLELRRRRSTAGAPAGRRAERRPG